MARWHVLGGIVLITLFAVGCGSSQAAQRMEVQAQLEQRLEVDPNAELCKSLAEEFSSGNHDALLPYFDTQAFVERVISYRTLPENNVAGLRLYHDQVPNFVKVYYPEGSEFLCLGTREFLGHPHIVIRQFTRTRYEYFLLLLKEEAAEKPISDYLVASFGLYHSEKQAYFNDPDVPSEKVGEWLLKSYDNAFKEIIDEYQSLPEAWQMSAYTFPHYLNAVYTTERTNSPLYNAATERIEPVFGERIYSVAYWRMIDAQRRGDSQTFHHYRGVLLELLDDYELLR